MVFQFFDSIIPWIKSICTFSLRLLIYRKSVALHSSANPSIPVDPFVKHSALEAIALVLPSINVSDQSWPHSICLFTYISYDLFIGVNIDDFYLTSDYAIYR